MVFGDPIVLTCFFSVLFWFFLATIADLMRFATLSFAVDLLLKSIEQHVQIQKHAAMFR